MTKSGREIGVGDASHTEDAPHAQHRLGLAHVSKLDGSFQQLLLAASGPPRLKGLTAKDAKSAKEMRRELNHDDSTSTTKKRER